MNNITFEETKISDYPEVAEIYNYYVLNSTATYHIATLPEEDIIKYFEIGKPSTFAYSIFLKSELIGFCLLRQYSKKEAYRYTYEITIYIKKDYTNRNAGTKAVEYLEEIAKKNNIKTIIAAICAENNASIRLFKKNNYEKCGYFKKMGFKFNKFLDNVYFQKILK